MYEKRTLFESEPLAIWDVTLGEHWFYDDLICKSYGYIYIYRVIEKDGRNLKPL